MTAYVDDMRAKFRRMVMCHMIGDDEAELHAMAARIGVARRWYQGDHYDVCLKMRARAVELGAVEITWRQAGMMRTIGRETGRLGTPAEADQRHAAMASRINGLVEERQAAARPAARR